MTNQAGHQVRLKAMGTECHIQTPDSTSSLRAADRLRELESLWSRFNASSEISALNRALGEPISATGDTIRLLEVAITAWLETSGRYDPTVHDAMIAIGYDRSFGSAGFGSQSGQFEPTFGCENIEIDKIAGTVRLPLGVRFDPGGIGKGLAADLIVEELTTNTPDPIIINIGGDLRVHGYAEVFIDEQSTTETVAFSNGGLATSTTKRRRWTSDQGESHHLIDPSTGNSAETRWTTASTIAGTAWWAEAATKPLLIKGPDAAPAGVAWRLIHETGLVETGGGWHDYRVARFVA